MMLTRCCCAAIPRDVAAIVRGRNARTCCHGLVIGYALASVRRPGDSLSRRRADASRWRWPTTRLAIVDPGTARRRPIRMIRRTARRAVRTVRGVVGTTSLAACRRSSGEPADVSIDIESTLLVVVFADGLGARRAGRPTVSRASRGEQSCGLAQLTLWFVGGDSLHGRRPQYGVRWWRRTRAAIPCIASAVKRSGTKPLATALGTFGTAGSLSIGISVSWLCRRE